MVQTRHGSEIARVDVRRIALGDERVGVSGIADDQNLDVLAGIGVDRLTLHGEDRSIGFQQILTLHTGAARACANQQSVIGIFESRVGIIGANGVDQQWESAVLQFHLHPLKSLHGWSDVQ